MTLNLPHKSGNRVRAKPTAWTLQRPLMLRISRSLGSRTISSLNCGVSLRTPGRGGSGELVKRRKMSDYLRLRSKESSSVRRGQLYIFYSWFQIKWDSSVAI
uniref:Uncharacterized protein n=2 Tax=Cacopsylla melanoneura TaxID=428564 RepID=A0A8D8X8R7_9HEMI